MDIFFPLTVAVGLRLMFIITSGLTLAVTGENRREYLAAPWGGGWSRRWGVGRWWVDRLTAPRIWSKICLFSCLYWLIPLTLLGIGFAGGAVPHIISLCVSGAPHGESRAEHCGDVKLLETWAGLSHTHREAGDYQAESTRHLTVNCYTSHRYPQTDSKKIMSDTWRKSDCCVEQIAIWYWLLMYMYIIKLVALELKVIEWL